MSRHQEDLAHIRHMMERSSTFISLSGLSGVGAGLTAMAAGFVIFSILRAHNIDYFAGELDPMPTRLVTLLIIVFILTLLMAVTFGIYFTVRKAKKLGYPTWTSSTSNTLRAAAVPLIVGGVFCIILVWHQQYYFVTPMMLVFYGLALVSASKYTLSEIYWLGIMDTILGLVAAMFIEYGLVLWVIGFGVLHIIYGAIMYKKYK